VLSRNDECEWENEDGQKGWSDLSQLDCVVHVARPGGEGMHLCSPLKPCRRQPAQMDVETERAAADHHAAAVGLAAAVQEEDLQLVQEAGEVD